MSHSEQFSGWNIITRKYKEFLVFGIISMGLSLYALISWVSLLIYHLTNEIEILQDVFNNSILIVIYLIVEFIIRYGGYLNLGLSGFIIITFSCGIVALAVGIIGAIVIRRQNSDTGLHLAQAGFTLSIIALIPSSILGIGLFL
jgi:hypothetical protein